MLGNVFVHALWVDTSSSVWEIKPQQFPGQKMVEGQKDRKKDRKMERHSVRKWIESWRQDRDR